MCIFAIHIWHGGAGYVITPYKNILGAKVLSEPRGIEKGDAAALCGRTALLKGKLVVVNQFLWEWDDNEIFASILMQPDDRFHGGESGKHCAPQS